MRRRLLAPGFACVFVLASGACNDNPGRPGPGVVDGGSGSKTIGLDGGVLSVGGTTLVVPRNAVSEDTKFSLKTRKVDAALPRADELTGFVVEVEPSGTNFARYATLHMLFFDVLPEGQTAQLVWLNGDVWEPVEESRLNENGLTGSISHLTTFGALIINAPPQSTCGNGIVEFSEGCDDGVNDGSYGGCNADCTRAGFCGDGVMNGPEGCDDGVYAGGYDGCNRDCTRGAFCGDGRVDAPQEACDDGTNDGSYLGCASDCTLAGFCGDGTVDTPDEACDDGVNDGAPGGCSPTCQGGAVCGDGIVALFFEDCDDGVFAGGYGGCNPDCSSGGFCGDGITQSPMESCDDQNIKGNDGCAPGCNIELATLTHSEANGRLVTFDWTSSLYDAAATNCDLEVDGGVIATVPCSADTAEIGLDAVGIPFTEWNQVVTFEVVPDVPSSAVGVRTVSDTLRCEGGSTSDITIWSLVPTPDTDEDCDGNFDNVVNQLKQTAATSVCNLRARDFFIEREGRLIGPEMDPLACKAACDAEIINVVLEGDAELYGDVNVCQWQDNECSIVTSGASLSATNDCGLQQRWNLDAVGPTYF